MAHVDFDLHLYDNRRLCFDYDYSLVYIRIQMPIKITVKALIDEKMSLRKRTWPM